MIGFGQLPNQPQFLAVVQLQAMALGLGPNNGGEGVTLGDFDLVLGSSSSCCRDTEKSDLALLASVRD